MKNKSLIMALSISFLLVLSGCGDQGPSNPSSNAAGQPGASNGEELTQTPPPEPTHIPYSLPPRKAIKPENVTQIEILQEIKIPGFLKSEHETCGVDIQSERMLAAVACKTKAVMVWDLETGEVWKRIYVGEIVNTVAFSPDGKFLAFGGRGPTVAVWDLSSQEKAYEITVMGGNNAYVSEIAFSPDGSLIAFGNFISSVFVYQTGTQTLQTVFTEHASRVNTVCFDSSGEFIISGGGDNKARLWSASTGEEVRVYTGASFYIEDVDIHPDGKTFVGASDDSTLRIWDIETGEVLHKLSGHRGPVNGVIYDRTGELVISTSNDGRLIIWDSNTGEQLAALSGHTDYAIRAAIDLENDLIASVAWDGYLILWGIPDL